MKKTIALLTIIMFIGSGCKPVFKAISKSATKIIIKSEGKKSDKYRDWNEQ